MRWFMRGCETCLKSFVKIDRVLPRLVLWISRLLAHMNSGSCGSQIFRLMLCSASIRLSRNAPMRNSGVKSFLSRCNSFQQNPRKWLSIRHLRSISSSFKLLSKCHNNTFINRISFPFYQRNRYLFSFNWIFSLFVQIWLNFSCFLL